MELLIHKDLLLFIFIVSKRQTAKFDVWLNTKPGRISEKQKRLLKNLGHIVKTMNEENEITSAYIQAAYTLK